MCGAEGGAIMSITKAREELQQARQLVASGKSEEALHRLDQAIAEIGPERLLTTTEAAEALGVRSVNTIKGWCHTGYLRGVGRGSRTLIPLAEVERIQNSDQVRAIRASDALHEASRDFSSPSGLDDEQLRDLAASRPGKPPWHAAPRE
jgi:excisionase family DNA binding protein